MVRRFRLPLPQGSASLFLEGEEPFATKVPRSLQHELKLHCEGSATTLRAFLIAALRERLARS
jgi:hypothetical protein